MKQRWVICLAILAAGCALASTSFAQLTAADFNRALDLQEKYNSLVVDLPDPPAWQDHSDTFVYRKSVEAGHAFILVDAATQTKQPAFDQAHLAAALSAASGTDYKADDLPFQQFHFLDDRAAIEFRVETTRWHCDLHAWTCNRLPGRNGEEADNLSDPDSWGYDDTPKPDNDPGKTVASPDGQWLAFVTNYNVSIRSKDGKQTFNLSQDGSEDNYYALSTLVWSPDSKHFAAYRIRPGYRRLIHYVESSPKDQLQPESFAMVYPKAGDVLTLDQPVLFSLADRREIPIDNALFPNPFDLTPMGWWKDSRAFTFEYNQRGHQIYRLIEVDANTGVARALITETSNTFINYEPLVMNQFDTGKKYRDDIDDGKEIIWASERDGWEHLYLFNGHTGALENQITRGHWVVRAVNHVDEQKRQIWFEASGMNPGEDPYFVHAYRINFDGSGLTPLTPDEANHHVEFSSDGKYYVDLWSRIDLAPTLALYRTEDNKQLMVLEHADISKLLAAGWHAPEVFNAKGRDGTTDIWGIIDRPANFDPHKKYPVIEDIYAGPQGSFVPKSFSTRIEPLTQLGFVVVQIDGMGTNNRSKAFHDVAWRNLKDAGFPDRILWHKAVAAKYPWYDISRVGVFGTSAGGQSAMGALLFHPDFYKVAVSNSGCHDNRMDKIWWNEQWMGWPVGPWYSASSNVDNAWRLQGKLMLIVGEMDHNVDPSSTFQVVDRLIHANKTFSLLVVPGADHGTRGPWARYTNRNLLDYFVRNLLNENLPDWNAQPATPPSSLQ
ncbi:MAG TPA: DPP IV N-terminal domain-containing protein [Acidobacteriaceae bacterium]|jgi:dipeptidyl aminopeptidase/acylaminoacyl peptidase|nr:DPP IV N-terminal domain-containing protein [Acidobacteriaceae bacterium]